MPSAVRQGSPMRSTTPGPAGFSSSPKAARAPNVKAFNRGRDEAFSDALDFCRKGLNNLSDEMLQDVRVELAHTIEGIRSEVTEIVESRSVRTDQKLDTIMSRLTNLAALMNEDFIKQQTSQMTDPLLTRSIDQAEANRKLAQRREDQIMHLTELLGTVTLQMETVQKKGDMDEMIERLLDRMDLPGMIGIHLTGFQQKFREMHAESKAQSADLSWGMEQVRKQLNRPVTADNTALLSEFKHQRREIDEEFEVVLAEIAKIQQALHLDYAMREAPEPESLLDMQVEKPKAHGSVTVHSLEQELALADEGVPRRRKKRVREFWTQADTETSDVWVQTDPELLKDKSKKKNKPGGRKSLTGDAENRRTVGLNDAEALKAKARANLMQPQYDVMEFYHTEGCAQAIARSSWFDNLTVALVGFNALWIAIDTDLNKSLIITDTDPVFIIVDNLFCLYFTCELCIRFGAFVKKLDAFRDTWFVFDFLIVVNMAVETWIMPAIMIAIQSEEGSVELDLSMLRIVRMVKLLRLSRVSRLVRSVPELVIIFKAIGFAARSVVVFFLLWLVMIYIFAIVLRQITDGSQVGSRWFPSVPDSMNTLLLNGILADYASFVHELGNGSMGGNAAFWVVIVVFILLSAITIMYMLVGVLVEVVGVIATAEKEGITVAYVAGRLREKMEEMGHNLEGSFSKFEFQKLLIEPDVCQLLTSVNVDVVVLVDQMDMVYEDIERAGGEMTFERMVDLVLNGRGANQATVRDTKEILRILKQVIKSNTDEVQKKLESEFQVINLNLSLLREEALTRDGKAKDSDSEDENRLQAVGVLNTSEGSLG